MAMPPPVIPEPRRYSVAEVLDFPPDGNRYEVVGGELLVTPAPRYRHQLIVARLAGFLRDYLKPMGFADAVLTSPAVAEVLSPSHSRGDRVTKRMTYQRHGVATYWIVDPEAALVEVWHPEDARPEIVTDVLAWRLGQAAPQLRISLAELFT